MTALLLAGQDKTTFQSIGLIRQIVERYLRDRDTPVASSSNGRFATRLLRDRRKLGISAVIARPKSFSCRTY